MFRFLIVGAVMLSAGLLPGATSGAADVVTSGQVQVVDGVVQPLRPVDEAITEAMRFLKNADGAYVPGQIDGELAGYFTSAFVNEDGSRTTRELAFPARQHAYFIFTFLLYRSHSGEEEWLLRARDLADWNLKRSTPSEAAWPGLPWSVYTRGNPGGSQDKDSLEPDKAAFLGSAYLAIYEATSATRYLDGAKAIANTLARHQNEDGSWPFRVVPDDGTIREKFGGAPVFFVQFFDDILRHDDRPSWRSARAKALKLMLDRNVEENLWGTYHEDVREKKKTYLSAEPMSFTAAWLFRNGREHPEYMEMGRRVIRRMEESLVHTKGHLAAPAPAVSEQAGFEHMMPGHTARYCMALAELYHVTGGREAKTKALSGINALTYMQSHAGLFRTFFQIVNERKPGRQRPNWYSQHLYTVCHVLQAMPLLRESASERLAPSSARPASAAETTGPIAFALYTVHKGTLKMTAQLYPPRARNLKEVTLSIERDGTWETVASSEVTTPAWTAHFRIGNWDDSRDARYSVAAGAHIFDGTIRKNPVDKPTIVAATFTGNSDGPGGGHVSRQDIVDALRKIDPDVLLFTGDQVYPHNQHTRHWIRFGEQFRDLIRDRPTVTIPDDHDVGHYNLFGAGGRPTKRIEDGGYVKPPEYVNMVQRQQTWHLPDPFDPTPVEQGITVYYTSLNIGGIDFAIFEDRKWKSGCADAISTGTNENGDHILVPDYDPKALDLPGKELLGERQLRFLDAWAQDWEGVDMKSVVSQTVFGMTTTHGHAQKQFYYADFDANGWPQTGRNKAVAALRRCFAFHICGDQHLGNMGQYGLDEWGDSGWWFCVPSIANTYPRWWEPKQAAVNPAPGATQAHTGDYFDGFGNRVTIYSHTNPRPSGREPKDLLDRMPGFGVVRFDKKARKITSECWPRMVDPETSPTAQYEGWPRTVSQLDNYGRKPAGHLPAVRAARDGELPVVQVVDEASSETLYTLRIPADGFRPPVFTSAPHTLHVTSGGHTSTRTGLHAAGSE